MDSAIQPLNNGDLELLLGTGKNWPIADQRVSNNYPRNTCERHFGSSSLFEGVWTYKHLMCTKIVPFYDLSKTQLTISFNLLVLNFLYSFFSSLHVIFFHEGVHGGQLDLPAKISIYTAVGYGGVLKFFRRVAQLKINKYKQKKYHMNRTAPLAISLENHTRKVP